MGTSWGGMEGRRLLLKSIVLDSCAVQFRTGTAGLLIDTTWTRCTYV